MRVWSVIPQQNKPQLIYKFTSVRRIGAKVCQLPGAVPALLGTQSSHCSRGWGCPSWLTSSSSCRSSCPSGQAAWSSRRGLETVATKTRTLTESTAEEERNLAESWTSAALGTSGWTDYGNLEVAVSKPRPENAHFQTPCGAHLSRDLLRWLSFKEN